MNHEQINGIPTWDKFKEYMTKMYTLVNHYKMIREQICNLKQLTTVQDYYVEHRKHCVQANNMTEEEKHFWFIKGLRPELAKHVELAKTKTTEDAYDEALTYETINKDKELSVYISEHLNKLVLNNKQMQRFNRTNNNNFNLIEIIQTGKTTIDKILINIKILIIIILIKISLTIKTSTIIRT